MRNQQITSMEMRKKTKYLFIATPLTGFTQNPLSEIERNIGL